ncbi:MAG: peptidoglycan DD-metalloendopeptidase family protein [Burkholderiales bacterium]|nr:peptidoglycan DD-metalloendopeptidase family protein [Burkholderiales bacterium]
MPFFTAARYALIVLLAAAVAGCASRATRAPVEDRASVPPKPAPPAAAAPALAPPAAAGPAGEVPVPTHVVKRGDTLYQIALDAGLDYRDLVAWNNIENPNVIRVGQVLRLAPPGEPAASPSGVTTAPLRTAPAVVEAKPGAPSASAPQPATAARNTENYKSQPKAFKEPYSEQALREAARVAPPEPVAMAAPAPAPAPRAESAPPPKPAINDGDDDDRLDWVWPAKGKIVGTFSETANLKGIDIAGSAGQPVVASAAGTVVYAGTGLRGYGKLIIVKHNKTYLSAYAHNRDILVKEGEKVTKGQKIAEMGNTDATEVKLHFEIRRLGKPMDPVRYLPPA